jgi:two-component system LytT family sensor kinase
MDTYSNSWLSSSVVRTLINSTRKTRILIHTSFWALIALFTAYGYRWSLQGGDWQVYGLVLTTNLLTITSSYYFLSQIGLPQLYKSRWMMFLVCVFGIYILHTAVNSLLFNEVASRYHLMERIANALGRESLWKTLLKNDTFLINWSFSLSTLMMPVVAKLVKDTLKQQQKTLELERDNLKLELKFLQSQIQPHFVLNSLNSVYAMVAGINDEAGTMLVRLSELLRYALHETSYSTVTLTRETEFLREYILLEAARQHERATLSFQHEGVLDGYHIPPLLLLTFVENAFKHGINATYRQAWAIFHLKIDENGLLQFHVENSMPPPDIRRGPQQPASGLGIENTRRRLKILFPDQHNLVIRKDSETFTVDLTLQLKRDKPKSANRSLPFNQLWNNVFTHA